MAPVSVRFEAGAMTPATSPTARRHPDTSRLRQFIGTTSTGQWASCNSPRVTGPSSWALRPGLLIGATTTMDASGGERRAAPFGIRPMERPAVDLDIRKLLMPARECLVEDRVRFGGRRGRVVVERIEGAQRGI